MRDKEGYCPGDLWYIGEDELHKDPNLRAYLRRTYAEKISKIQVAIVAALATAVLALVVRQVEYLFTETPQEKDRSYSNMSKDLGLIRQQNQNLQNKINSILLQTNDISQWSVSVWGTQEHDRKQIIKLKKSGDECIVRAIDCLKGRVRYGK